MMSKHDIIELLDQHRSNLALWRSGYLNPTEPDPVEREAVIRELVAAIETLERVLGKQEVPATMKPLPGQQTLF